MKKKLKKRYLRVRSRLTTGIKSVTKSQWNLPELLNKVVEVLGIVAIATMLVMLFLIIVPVVILYIIVAVAIVLWEEYGIREQSSNSSR